jgi:hypothetical protein
MDFEDSESENVGFASNSEFKIKKGFTCEKCKDTGIVKEDDNSVHVCFDCLREGRLDVHSKDLQDTGLKFI